MMAHTVYLDVAGYGPEHGSGTAAVAHYDFLHRLGRALRLIALIWLVAIPLMMIPYIIILTLPAAIGLTVYFGYERLTAFDHARTCEGTCPDCGARQTFDLPDRFVLPLDVECCQCNRELTLAKRQ